MSDQRMKKHTQKSQQDEHQNIYARQQSRLNSIVQMQLMKKQGLGVSFSGVIKSGVFKNDYTLNIQYAFYAGPDWQMVGGQPSGISFKSSSSEQKIIWNFPFGVSYQAKSLQQWPQIIVILFGSDHFGRSMPRGYGNICLPASHGTHTRKIRIFRPLQPSSIWSCINFCSSSILEIKQAQKNLGNGKQRKFLKVEYAGQIQVQIQTILINFQKHGYT